MYMFTSVKFLSYSNTKTKNAQNNEMIIVEYENNSFAAFETSRSPGL